MLQFDNQSLHFFRLRIVLHGGQISLHYSLFKNNDTNKNPSTNYSKICLQRIKAAKGPFHIVDAYEDVHPKAMFTPSSYSSHNILHKPSTYGNPTLFLQTSQSYSQLV